MKWLRRKALTEEFGFCQRKIDYILQAMRESGWDEAFLISGRAVAVNSDSFERFIRGTKWEQKKATSKR